MLTQERIAQIKKVADRHATSTLAQIIRELLAEREEMQRRAAEFSQMVLDDINRMQATIDKRVA